jgi:hypothetical protein
MLSFHPVDPEAEQAEDALGFDDTECSCEKPDDQYLLDIDQGAVSLVHKACGKQMHGDYHDLVEAGPVPVTVKAVPYGGCDGQQWHGEYQCDCGIILATTVNDRAVVHDGRPYLIGRDYKDKDWDLWRITGNVDAQGQPLMHLVARDGTNRGGLVPIGRVASFWNRLILQPLPKEA